MKQGPKRRNDPEKHKAQVRAANRARYKAIQVLINRHPGEFATIYARFAEEAGVEPKPRERFDVNELERQLRELEQRLAKARKAQQNGDGSD